MGQTIQVTTAQNVQIDFNLASVSDRMVAGILDLLIIFVGLMLLSMFIGMISGGLAGSGFLAYLIFIPIVFYSLISEIITSGQTLGKKIMNIKTVQLDGSELTIGTYFMRWIFRLIDIWFIGVPGIPALIMVALSGKSQRLGDIVANTTVVTLKKQSTLRKTAYVKVNPDYIATFPAVSQLIPSEIETIKEVLRLRGEGNFSVLNELSDRIETVLNISKTEPARQFLIRVVKDFNHLERVRAVEELKGLEGKSKSEDQNV